MTVDKSDGRPKGDRVFSLAERATKAFGGNRRTGYVWIQSDHRLLGGRTPRAVAEASEEGLAEALQALEADQRSWEILATPSIQLALLRVLRATDTVADVIKETQEAAHSLRYDVSQLFRELAAEMACDTLSDKNPIAVEAELDAVCRHFFEERSELGRQAQAIFGPRAGYDWLNTPNPNLQGLTPHESIGEILFCDILRVLQADRWSLDHPGNSKVRMGWWRVLQLMGTDASIAEEVPETTGCDNDGEDYAGGAWLDLAPELGAKAQRLLGRTAGRKWMRTPHPALYGIAPYTHVVREWSDAKAMEVLERDWAWLDNPDDPNVDPAWLEVLGSLGATSGKSPKGEVDD